MYYWQIWPTWISLFVQDLILKAAKQQDYQTELDFIIDYYGNDFDVALLKTNLEIFSANMQSEGQDATLSDVIEFFKAKNIYHSTRLYITGMQAIKAPFGNASNKCYQWEFF